MVSKISNKSKMYIENSFKAAAIILKSGITLNQVRFHYHQNILSDEELSALNFSKRIVEDNSQIDNGITVIHIVLFHDKYSPNSKLTFVPPNPKEFFNINFF
mgnify:CR=1 FL=1